MNRIHQQWGAAIEEACKYSSVAPAFLAALIALESGGNPQASRFEKHVYNKLINAQRGYGVGGATPRPYANLSHGDLKAFDDQGIRNLATSWGLTQVMGYHVARRPGGIEILVNPETHLKFALGLLAEFAERYGLNVTLEFEEMLRCWNTGKPYGETFDPKYVENGLRRMAAYRAIEPSGD